MNDFHIRALLYFEAMKVACKKKWEKTVGI